MVNICLPSCLSPALLLPKSGNASFPGETKLLLYHSGPQVFHCSPTVSCKQWCGEGGWRREHLPMPISHRHTQMLFVMPVHFQKAAGCPITDCVPNWHATAVCTDSSTGRHNEALFFFFFKILNHDLISPLQLCGLEPTVPTKIIRGIMCFICEDDHQSSGSDRSARGKYTWLRIACGFTKFRF